MPYEMFPQEIIELQREIQNHPELIGLLKSLGSIDPWDRFACVAAYCEIILDGMYSEDDIKIIADTLTHRLKDKRALVINTLEKGTITVVSSLEPAPPPEEVKKILLQ